ncbi:MAG: ATP synthase F0 subunit B [Thermodesulfovibrionales bacterium]
MLEFNNWYFVLLANFLILLVVLNAILFQPIKKVLKEREGSINDMLADAKSMMAKKDELLKKINLDLTDAKIKAKETYEKYRQEGIAYQKDVMSRAEADAVEMIEKARKDIKEQTEKARAALRSDIEKLASEIMNKLVKV